MTFINPTRVKLEYPVETLQSQIVVTVWLGTGDWVPHGGAPITGSIALRWQAWLFDAAVEEAVTTTYDMPNGWETVHVDLYWTNAGAGAGNVVWWSQVDHAADGTTLGVSGALGSMTATAPAQDVLKITRLHTSVAVTATSLQGMRLRRIATDAADTLPNDAAVLGVMITRGSL